MQVEFVHALDAKYECVLCRNLLSHPVQFEDCGHRMCGSCFTGYYQCVPRSHLPLPAAASY